MLLDIVFSLDSVITAVGMANDLGVMVAAVVLAVGVMMWSADAISGFVDRHPTVKILALSFLLLIGVSLVADGFEQHIPKGYIYFAMAFSVFVEMINLRVRPTSQPISLRRPLHGREGTARLNDGCRLAPRQAAPAGGPAAPEVSARRWRRRRPRQPTPLRRRGPPPRWRC